jgi:hypothetical protein
MYVTSSDSSAVLFGVTYVGNGETGVLAQTSTAAVNIPVEETLCGQNAEIMNVKRRGTYSNHWALYLKTQSVPRSKHTPSQLYNPVS